MNYFTIRKKRIEEKRQAIGNAHAACLWALHAANVSDVFTGPGVIDKMHKVASEAVDRSIMNSGVAVKLGVEVSATPGLKQISVSVFELSNNKNIRQ